MSSPEKYADAVLGRLAAEGRVRELEAAIVRWGNEALAANTAGSLHGDEARAAIRELYDLYWRIRHGGALAKVAVTQVDETALERYALSNELYNTKRCLVRRMQTVANCRARGVFGYLDAPRVSRLCALITACKKWLHANPRLYQDKP